MKGYKGFEPGLICRGKQYAENTVRWTEEYRDAEPRCRPEFRSYKIKLDVAKARIKIFRLATLACAVLTGFGLAILLNGLDDLHVPSILVGIIVAGAFIVSGYLFDAMAEEEMDNVT